jgi:ferredoxin, 2Fe-2S
MPIITYISSSSAETRIDVPVGSTVMEGAAQNDVQGIEAECGGACACGTCHIYIDEAWRALVGPPNDMEAALLEFASAPQPNSRLACQISVTAELDGLTVRMPATQP